ncbi:MAG: F0F1 ATP synthase subunit gamma [Bifidobacteriaceae bacterium]|nr:F0F1 ATP synthase subunit gamma [Bifidobacteriaceae bacterium]
MASQLAYKSRIASTKSLAKIFNAQEMIASSHIAKARDVALEAKPYSDAISDALAALVAHAKLDHPIFKKHENKPNPHVAVLALTSDRGMAGAYTSSVLRETETLLKRLDDEGKIPELYVYGRRGITYYKYRNRDIKATWEGHTDEPGVEIAEEISKTLLDAYMKPGEQGGVSELYIVYTEFINMVSQKVRILRMLPVQVVTKEIDPNAADAEEQIEEARDLTAPLYSFEPSADEVLDKILPKYVQSRIHECLLTAAASETASRQNAMHTATDNANNLIDDLTRKYNATRQASITQELTEIIASADALNTSEE